MANKTAFFEKKLLNRWLRRNQATVAGGNASTSNILVGASTGFDPGDLVKVSSTGSFHLVTAIPDGTHITISPALGSAPTTGTIDAWGYAPGGHNGTPAVYVGLFTAAPTDAGGGTEAVGGSYARVAVNTADGSWGAPAGSTSTAISGSNASTTNLLVASSTGFAVNDIVYLNSAGEISRHTVTSVPDGTHVTVSPACGAAPTTGTLDRPSSTSNSGTVTFPQSTATWGGTMSYFGLFDSLTGGNLLEWGALTTPQAVTASGITPSFAAGALALFED